MQTVLPLCSSSLSVFHPHGNYFSAVSTIADVLLLPLHQSHPIRGHHLNYDQNNISKASTIMPLFWIMSTMAPSTSTIFDFAFKNFHNVVSVSFSRRIYHHTPCIIIPGLTLKLTHNSEPIIVYLIVPRTVPDMGT